MTRVNSSSVGVLLCSVVVLGGCAVSEGGSALSPQNVLFEPSGKPRRSPHGFILTQLRLGSRDGFFGDQLAELIEERDGKGYDQLACATALFELLARDEPEAKIPARLLQVMVRKWVKIGATIGPCLISVGALKPGGPVEPANTVVCARIEVVADTVIPLDRLLLFRWRMRDLEVMIDGRNVLRCSETLKLMEAYRTIDLIGILGEGAVGTHERIIRATIVCPNGQAVDVAEREIFEVVPGFTAPL